MNTFRQRRLASGLTVKEAAKILLLSCGYLYAIETGKRIPGLKAIAKMACLYGCSLDSFFLPCGHTDCVKKETK